MSTPPPVKRRNHEVPRGILKNWLATASGRRGFHYVNLENGSLCFESGVQAKFAITEYLYVPLVARLQRNDALENWFSVDENGLAPFARAAQAGQLNEFQNKKLMNQAIRACIALGYRSAYHF